MGWVEEQLENVGDAVGDALEWVADEVIEPSVETIGDVIQGALDNPVKTIAQITAIVTQQYWALPLIEGADVAAKGGDLEDVAKAVAISIIAQEAGARVGGAVGSSTTNAATAANYGTTAASQQTAMLAAQEAGMQTASQIAGNIAGSAAGSATVAVVTGQDPVKAMITGGVNAAVPAVLGQIDGFRDLTPTTQKVIETAVKTQLAGGNVGAAVIRSAIVSSQIAADTIKKLDPENKLSKGQQSILADVVTAASVAAFTKGNVSNAIQKEIFNAGAKALGDMAKGKFTELTNGTQKSSERMTDIARQITANETKQNEAVKEYNIVRDQLNVRIEEQNRLKKAMDDNVWTANTYIKEYNAGNLEKKIAENWIATANKSVENYNNYVSALNSDYQNVFKPGLDKYQAQLDALKIPHDQLVADFTKEQQNLENLATQLGKEVEVLESGVKKAFVGVMDINFNPNEYRQINKLDSSIDPYEHWLSTGQYERLPTNYKAAESAVMDEQARLLIEALGARDLKLTNLTKEDRDRFYDTIEKQFGNDFTALKNANIADFDIDDILKTSSSLTINEDMVKDTYNADNRPSVSTYTAPDGYKLANQDEIFGNKAVLMPTSNGAFAWLTPDTASRDGYFWDPETGNQVLRITITGVGDPLKVETHGVGSTMEELRDSDPLGWFEMYKDLAPENRQKADLGDIVYNYIKDTYDKFAGSLDPATKEAIAKFAAAAKPESTTLDLMSGVVNGIKAITDAFGANNTVSKALGNARGYIQSLYSAEAMNDKALQARILDEAKDKGVLDQVIAGMEAIAAYPGIIVESTGTIVTSVATAMATTVLGAPAVVARLAQLGVGAVSGAGIIKGTIYDETKKALIAAGVDPGTAEIKAQQAQAYNGKNLDSIVYGALLGTAAAGTGVEKALTKEIASNIAEGVAAKEIAKQFVVGGLKEGIPEAAQGGQEKLAENIALQREGFNVPTWRGVAAAGALEGLAGAPIGGAADVAAKMKPYDLAFTSRPELEEIAKQEGYTLTSSDFDQYTGAKDETKTLQDFQSFADPRATTREEAIEFFKSQGYTQPTEAQISELTQTKIPTQIDAVNALNAAVGRLPFDAKYDWNGDGKISAGDALNILKASQGRLDYTPPSPNSGWIPSESRSKALSEVIADPFVFDVEEVKAIAREEGFSLTDEQARQIAREERESEAASKYRSEIDPLATTSAEASEFFRTYGYLPNSDELTQFIQSKPETEIKTAIGEYVDPRQLTLEELQELAKSEGYQLSQEDIKNYVKQGIQPSFETQTSAAFRKYSDPLATLEVEARQFLADQGYVNPTKEDVNKIVGQILESEAQKQSIGIADPNVFDINEVKAVAAEEGYALSDEQAKALARQVNEAEATRLFRAEIDPLAVTSSEAKAFFDAYGYPATPEELALFVASKPEAEVQPTIYPYVDPRQVTSAEAQAFFDKYGYKPTAEDLAFFTRQGKDVRQDIVQKEVAPYVDPRMTTTPEVVQAYRELGLDQPTQEDVIRFIGQRPEAETLEEVKKNVDRARYNALQRSIAQGQIQAQRNKVMGENLALLTGAAAPAVAADDAAKFKKPFITSTAKQEEFKGPLQEFLEEVKTSDYTIQPFMESQSPTTPQVQENMQQGESMPSYFTYGQPADLDQLFSPFGTAGTSFFGMEPMLAKRGGLATPLMAGGGMTRYGRYAGGGLPMVAHSGKARVDFRQGDAVTGPGDGQSDDIPAMLADGEFVIPADVVAALGNGSTKAGSDKLYDMMHSIRAHHRSASPKDLPPPAKANPLDYLKGKKSARKARR